jgi:hypothetical protein
MQQQQRCAMTVSRVVNREVTQFDVGHID